MSVLVNLIKDIFLKKAFGRGNAAQRAQIDQNISIALAYQQAGRQHEAEKICRAILQVQPHHPDASLLMAQISGRVDGDPNSLENPARERKVLNVGGNSKEIPIPPQYDGWEHVLLDIDPKGHPDVVCDARDLMKLPGANYDSVYCSHNLEHYYRHDAEKVLAGFLYVLKDEGFVDIRVPDMDGLMKAVVQRGLDIDDFLYHSPAGPITVSDVIYGYGEEIKRSGNDFYAHKTGFTQKSLKAILLNAGFPIVFTRVENLEITALAFKGQPSDRDALLFNLSGSFPADPDKKMST